MSFNFPLIYPLFAPLPELVGFLSGRSGRGGGKGWLEVEAWPGKAGWFELEPGKPFLSFSFGKPFQKNYRPPGKPGSQLNPWSGGSNLGFKLIRRTLQQRNVNLFFSFLIPRQAVLSDSPPDFLVAAKDSWGSSSLFSPPVRWVASTSNPPAVQNNLSNILWQTQTAKI